MGVEDGLVELAAQMVRYACNHSFQGKSQKADLLGFCKLNKQYSLLERRLHAPVKVPLSDKWDVARNKIVTYITQKCNNKPADPIILGNAFVMVAVPYDWSIAHKVPFQKVWEDFENPSIFENAITEMKSHYEFRAERDVPLRKAL